MVCYSPLIRVQDLKTINLKTGKPIGRVIGSVFDYPEFVNKPDVIDKYHHFVFQVISCGQCIGCRLAKSREWAIRIEHEASMHKQNCFLTLTYDDMHIPCNSDGEYTLDKLFFQKWVKNFRQKLVREFDGITIRFYQCGEYGTLYSRPHHHMIVFGFDFPDKYEWKRHGTVTVYRSPTLERYWPYGFCTVGEVNFDSAAYVARYCLKKITGKLAEYTYDGIQPEYSTMSNRPGIGAGWFEKYKDDVYNYDYLVTKKGFKMRPPSYYDRLYDIQYPNKMEKIKNNRKNKIKIISINRLFDKEKVKKIKIKKLVRSYENG